jgi:hypothetical protein
MPITGKVLEDSVRLSKIRRIKFSLYVVQTVVLVSIAFYVAFLMGGSTLKPRLYLPVPAFAGLVVLLLLVLCIESFFFRVLEIRFARSSSARHLMAKNSIRRSIVIAVLTGSFALILLTPPIVEGLAKASTGASVATSTKPFEFYSNDVLALTRVDELHVTAARAINVYLVTESNYQDHNESMGELFSLRINRDSYVVQENQALVISVPTPPNTAYRLVVDDHENQGTSATVTTHKAVSHVFTSITSLFLVAFVVSNIAWIAYLVPIERKYSAGSIYK